MKRFPQKTYEKMLEIVRDIYFIDNDFRLRFEEINVLDDDNKKNRWLGYYQRVGEELALWTLEDVKKWVREEKEIKNE